MGAPGISDEYSPPRLSRLLHALPHINVTLHRVNDTFAPNSPVYLESLGILGSIPGAWLILTLTVLLIYLLTRCCDRKQRPPRSITALKITLMILSVMCCGAIGVGLFGNDDLHNAMLQSIQAGNQLAALVNTVKNQSSILEEAMGSRARAPLARLADALDAPVSNQTALGTLLRALSALRNNASAAASAADNLRRPLAALNLDAFMKRAWVWEAARWAGGMAGWCCGGAVCVALLAAAARRSRRALLLLCVGALGALVVCWLAGAVLAAGAVAAADACQEPAAALALHAPHNLPIDMVHYYLSCKVSRENVLTAELRNAQRAVVAVRQALAVLARGAPQLFNDPGLQPALGALGAGTGEAERALVALSGALECRMARAYFVAAARAACDAGLQALSLQLLAAVAAGFLFTAIVLVDSHAWIYINTNHKPPGRRRSAGGEEQAPFLSSGSSQASRSLPRAAPYNNGKPPSYGAAVQLMDLERPRIMSHSPSYSPVDPQHLRIEDEGNHGNDDTRLFILSTLAGQHKSKVSCSLCKDTMHVFDRYPLVDGTFFLSPRQHTSDAVEVKVEGRTQYLTCVCMGCLERCDPERTIRCRFCGQKWDGSSLVLGTMYSYDIFMATPCCAERLKCNNCFKGLFHPQQQLNYSDYSHPVTCPHCRVVDTHFVKPLSYCFTKRTFPLYQQWP